MTVESAVRRERVIGNLRVSEPLASEAGSLVFERPVGPEQAGQPQGESVRADGREYDALAGLPA